MGLEKPVLNGSGGNKVKHIQRGLVGSGTKDGNYFKITLSGFTNLSKMVVLLNGDTHPSNSSVYSAVWVSSLTLDTLTVGVSSSDYVSASYQVIEFD